MTTFLVYSYTTMEVLSEVSQTALYQKTELHSADAVITQKGIITKLYCSGLVTRNKESRNVSAKVSLSGFCVLQKHISH